MILLTHYLRLLSLACLQAALCRPSVPEVRRTEPLLELEFGPPVNSLWPAAPGMLVASAPLPLNMSVTALSNVLPTEFRLLETTPTPIITMLLGPRRLSITAKNLAESTRKGTATLRHVLITTMLHPLREVVS